MTAPCSSYCVENEEATRTVTTDAVTDDLRTRQNAAHGDRRSLD